MAKGSTSSGAYIRRSMEEVLRRSAREFPALVLSGPRQSGKTTLLKHVFGSSHPYVSFELPDVQLAAKHDPRGFLDLHPPPIIFDEVQYAPNFLPYIKERIDAHRSQKGQFLLSGSQNLLLMEQVSETLAGRAAMLKLLPLSQREVNGRPDQKLPWESRQKPEPLEAGSGIELWKTFLRGGYPELVTEPNRSADLWHSSYVQSYLERDVRTLRQVGDLAQFQNFLRALAARSAQLLNLTDLGRDIGVSVNTVKGWLSVLEATYQITIIRSYHANVSKRMVKSPKVYFTDVGTLCYLVGLKDPTHAAASPMAGAIMETAVLSEIIKSLLHRGVEPNVYFWRTAAGMEVDFLVQVGEKLVPIEVKSSATPKPMMASNIHSLQNELKELVEAGYVVHPGNVTLPLGASTIALPFAEL